MVNPPAFDSISNHRYAALRMVAAVIAAETPGVMTEPQRGRNVARLHTAARRLAAHRLRLAYDGDRYYVTAPPSPDQLDLWSQRPPGTEASEALVVLGTADNLRDLVTVVDRITDRRSPGVTDDERS